MPSIDVPPYTVTPFNDYLGDARLDWAQSSRSQWFLRGASDRYTTQNDLVQQGALPSTGATSRSIYYNFALGNQIGTQPRHGSASLTLDAGILHRTEVRNQYVRLRAGFPFHRDLEHHLRAGYVRRQHLRHADHRIPRRSAISRSISSATTCRTCPRKHATKFGINFIHEPVLSGCLRRMRRRSSPIPKIPTFYAANPSQFYFDRHLRDRAHRPEHHLHRDAGK